MVHSYGYGSLNYVRTQAIPTDQDELLVRFTDSVHKGAILRR